jgi:hypothetical protein
MKDLCKINAEIETFKVESESLTERIKAAGARARKSTLEMRETAKEFRKFLSKNQKIIFYCFCTTSFN